MANSTSNDWLLGGLLVVAIGALAGGIVAAIASEWVWLYVIGGIAGTIGGLVLTVGVIAKGVEVGNRSGG